MPNHLHVRGVHHVAIRASDFDATIRFYTEGLGFTLTRTWVDKTMRAAMIDTGTGSHLEIFSGGVSGDRSEGHWNHLAFICDDVESAIAKVKALGCQVTVDSVEVAIPSDPPLPVRLAFFKGPDGEVIELFQTLEG